jgi:hypothetical protein
VFLGWGGVFVDDALHGGAGYDRIVNPGQDGGLTLAYYGTDLSIEEIVGAVGFADQHVEGTAAANVLDFSQTKLTNLLYVDGRGGSDQITASALTAGMHYRGGTGADVFAVTAAAAGTEQVVEDFHHGTDTIDLRALGVSYSALSFAQDGADRLVQVHLAGGAIITIRLQNFNATLDASDFLLA